MPEPAVEVRELGKRFPVRRSLAEVIGRRPRLEIRALDGISFEVGRGEVLAIVGESGCGKTTTANLILGLTEPSAGRVVVGGQEVGSASKRHLRRIRRSLQMVFQDPYESLNPRMTVGEIVTEPLRVHRVADDPAEERGRVEQALEQAGLTPPDLFWRRRPHELSGGQRQRVVIAAALALEPEVLIADEPVSMLDVSIRAEILNLLARLASDRGIAIVMITHDLSTVAAYSDRIAVMYLGRIVEIGPTPAVLRNPSHPYTEALLSVVPVPNPDHRPRPVILAGEAPDPARVPVGCRFHPRCPKAFDRCPQVDPILRVVADGHAAACLLVEGSDPQGAGVS